MIDDYKIAPGTTIHPPGVDLTHAEVRRVMELESMLPGSPEPLLDRLARVALSLGARAPGALSERLHGPCRPLDGSDVAANRTPWRKP